jgi:DNA-binding NarL/FixJ family response regulator
MSKSMSHDRGGFSVLVVCTKGATSSQLRQALKALGFSQISAAGTHIAALERAKMRPFTHVVFEAKSTDMPAHEFVTQIIEHEDSAIMIAISDEPRIDDVFGLLRAGARGFLVPPFTTDMLEEVMTQATEGPTLSDAVLNAPDRNGAFTAVILNNLYRLSVAMRQSREFESAARDVKNYNYQLRESVELAQLFCEGGDLDLRDKIIEGCLNRAKDAATRLGRLRKKLKRGRVDEDGNEIEEAAP